MDRARRNTCDGKLVTALFSRAGHDLPTRQPARSLYPEAAGGNQAERLCAPQAVRQRS